ncbi:MAG TPA: hydantoinase/oxoprolinase family protein [Alphaproteobacteria bacterium]|nr:hydantoinase/oxoprolinase family protein [Alphaproteobacteria bacterium]
MQRKFFVGVDIGGTFTDLVLAEDGTARFHNVKTLTTPANPVEGVIKAVTEALAEVGAQPTELRRLVHATTLPTNLVLERNGARVAYVTTKGFGDIFELSKQKPVGVDRFNLLYRRPPPLVPRDMVAEIPERMDAKGQVVRPLDLVAAEEAIRQLEKKRPEAVAVCFMHAYANPAHERAVGDLIRKHMPYAYVSLSSDVWPEFQEYERASTTVLSGYIGPTLSAYVHELEHDLEELGIRCSLQIMQSSGGVMTAADAARKAAYVIESGPAAGVIASAHLGQQCGHPDLISFDMGGTTAKAGVVRHGRPRITHDFRVGGSVSAGAKGSGEPIRIPVIDLAEVGAGGGSIAWVDDGGLIQVGPKSAGASPGPACYGFGGVEPTVTDANVVLGYLNPDYFLGGKMEIHPDLSRKAIAERVGDKVGLDVVAAAEGIYELANTHMGSAIRIVTLQRGIDPREFAITAFGGAGPIHVVKVAEQFDIPLVIVPPSPGVKSAFGLLVSDLAYDYVATSLMPAADADFAQLNRIMSDLEQAGRSDLGREGTEAEIRIERALGVRFMSQMLDLAVPIADGPITAATIAQADKDFRELYFEMCGMRPTDPCFLVSCQVRAVGVVPKPEIPAQPKGDGKAERALKTSRRAYFGEAGFVETRVYDRTALRPGDRIAGPAILEEPDSTTVCPPGYAIEVDPYLNVLIGKE